MPLTIDEKTILNIYYSPNKGHFDIITEIRDSIDFTEESQIQETMRNLVRKIAAMNEGTFRSIDFSDILEVEVDEKKL